MKYMVFVYALSLLLRLGFVLLVGHGDLSLDEIEYHMLAANVAEGNGYTWFFGLTSTFRPPGYPLLLSVLYFFTGPDYFLARVVQSFIAASIPVFTYLLGREVFNEPIGKLAGLFTALYPPLVVHCAALLTENVFIPLLCLGFWLLVLSKRSDRLYLHVIASLVIALAIFVRPSFTFFLPVICLWILFARPDWRQRFQRVAILAGVWALVVTPWCVRNYLVTGEFIYLDTRAGYNMYVGFREGADGSFDMEAAGELVDAYMELNIPRIQSSSGKAPSKQEVYQRLNRELLSYKLPAFPNHIPQGLYDLSQVESDILIHQWGMEKARNFIRENPWEAAALLPKKFMSFWNLEHRLFVFAYSQNFLGHLPAPLLALFFAVLVVPFAAITLLAVLGAAGLRFRADVTLLLLGIIVYYSALHSVVFGEARLHYPLVPILSILAAAGYLNRKKWMEALRAETRKVRMLASIRLLAASIVCCLFCAIWTYGLYQSWERIATVFGPGGNTSRLPF